MNFFVTRAVTLHNRQSTLNKRPGILILLILLAACAPVGTSTPLAPSTARPAADPGETASVPTVTPSPALPTASPSPVPTELTRTAAGELCDLGASRFNVWDRAFSPNGAWGAVLCEGDPLLTRVYRLDGSQIWRLPAYSLEFANAADRVMLLPFHWSADGRYLYLASSICCQQDPTTEFEDGYSLARLDLTSGILVPVLGPLHQRDGYALSFSPGDRYLTYIPPGEITLIHMIDLASGFDNVMHLKTQYWDAGFFAWSPSGNQVIFAAGMPDWVTGEGGFSLLLYDLPNEKLRLLVNNDMRQPAPAGPTWLNDNEVALVSLVNGEKLKLNVATREISPGE